MILECTGSCLWNAFRIRDHNVRVERSKNIWDSGRLIFGKCCGGMIMIEWWTLLIRVAPKDCSKWGADQTCTWDESGGGFTPVLIQDNWVLWSSISHCMLWTRDRYFTVLKEQTDGTPEVETSRLRKVVGTPGHFVVMERLLLFNCPHPAADKSCQYERGSACLCTRPPQVIRQQYEVSQWHVQ